MCCQSFFDHYFYYSLVEKENILLQFFFQKLPVTSVSENYFLMFSLLCRDQKKLRTTGLGEGTHGSGALHVGYSKDFTLNA